MMEGKFMIKESTMYKYIDFLAFSGLEECIRPEVFWGGPDP